MLNVCFTFFTNSINITFFILLMVLLEPLLKRYLSAVCLYRFWIVLLLGLLIPIHFGPTKALFYISSPQFSVEDKVALEPEVKKDNIVEEVKADLLQKLPTQDTEYVNTQEIRKRFSTNFFRTILYHIIQNRYFCLCLIWILGAAFLLSLKGTQYYILLKRMNRFKVPFNQESMIKQYYQYDPTAQNNDGRELLLTGKIKLQKCSIITSPMTIGICKPTILLPDECYSKEELGFVLKHELIHIRRKDSLVKCIRLLVLALNWYNPFCYILSGRLDTCCETSCDELVINNSTRAERLNYSKLLLRCIIVEKERASVINMIGGKNNMKNRLCLIMNYRKKHSGKQLMVLLFSIVFTTAFVSINCNTEAATASVKEAEAKKQFVQTDKTDKNKKGKAIAFSDKASFVKEQAINTNKDKETTKKKNASAIEQIREDLVEYAINAEGTSYLWGGNNLSTGVDSSGFVQAVYKSFDYDLPRTSSKQASTYEEVSLDHLLPGDLVFYSDSHDKVNHVGIYIGKDKIIHAKNSRDGVVIQDINYRTPHSAVRVITK